LSAGAANLSHGKSVGDSTPDLYATATTRTEKTETTASKTRLVQLILVKHLVCDLANARSVTGFATFVETKTHC
jgi:hypothetical protein